MTKLFLLLLITFFLPISFSFASPTCSDALIWANESSARLTCTSKQPCTTPNLDHFLVEGVRRNITGYCQEGGIAAACKSASMPCSEVMDCKNQNGALINNNGDLECKLP